jgi:hypothetical protein
MIDKYSFIEDFPVTVLSLVNRERWQKNKGVILGNIYSDNVMRKIVAYWALIGDDIDGSYNCGKAFNEGLKESNSGVIVYSTGDVVIEPFVMLSSYIQLLSNDRPVFTLRVDQNEDNSWTLNDNAIGDFIMVRKEWADAVGGWDERLLDWGAGDYDFLFRVCNYLDPNFSLESALGECCLGVDTKSRVKHLYHSRRSDEWYREGNKKNWAIIKEQGAWK